MRSYTHGSHPDRLSFFLSFSAAPVEIDYLTLEARRRKSAHPSRTSCFGLSESAKLACFSGWGSGTIVAENLLCTQYRKCGFIGCHQAMVHHRVRFFRLSSICLIGCTSELESWSDRYSELDNTVGMVIPYHQAHWKATLASLAQRPVLSFFEPRPRTSKRS